MLTPALKDFMDPRGNRTGDLRMVKAKGKPMAANDKKHKNAAKCPCAQLIRSQSSGKEHVRMPGVEPGSQAWEASMMPLHYMRF